MDLEKYNLQIEAGRITSWIRDYARNIVKVDASLLECTELIESKIQEMGAKIAFPNDMSINSMAAHYSALLNDTTKFQENDLIKVDIGAHIQGHVVDTALTVNLGNDNKELVKASEDALKEAIKLATPGRKLKEIGEVINNAIENAGFNSIKNLSGHGIGHYLIHTKPTVPNFNNNDNTELYEGQIIAIEPFASTGVGLVTEGKPSEIYALLVKKQVRDQTARKVLGFIEKEYNTLPFAKRWLAKHFNPLQLQLALNNLEREGIIKQYAQLPEKSKGLVSQAEHTILVLDKPRVLTLEENED